MHMVILSKWHVCFLKKWAYTGKKKCCKVYSGISIILAFFFFFPFCPYHVYLHTAEQFACLQFWSNKFCGCWGIWISKCAFRNQGNISISRYREALNENCFISLTFFQQNARGSSLVSHSMSWPFLGVRFKFFFPIYAHFLCLYPISCSIIYSICHLSFLSRAFAKYTYTE